MLRAARQLVCIYIVNSVPFPGPGPVGPIFRASQFSVPLPELGHAHCAEPTGGTRPGGTCPPVSPSLGGSRVRAGSARTCASAPDMGSGQGPSSAGAAAAASQRHGRASGSAVTGHEWPHADGAPAGTVLEPFVRLSLDLCVGPRPRGSARGRGQTGSRSRALQDRFAGPPPHLDFIAGRPFPFRCTLIATHLHSLLLTPSARRRRFVVFFLQKIL